jgi:UPF0716 protein FxsA
MFARLALLFTVVPLVELAILIRIGQAISLGPTLGIIIVTGVVGATLAKRQGLRTLSNIQAELAQGRVPTADLVDGLMILIAGALLVTPGVLTDAVGFILLVPISRRILRKRLRRYFERRVFIIHPPGTGSAPPGHPGPDAFIDVEAKEVTPQPDRDDSDQSIT